MDLRDRFLKAKTGCAGEQFEAVGCPIASDHKTTFPVHFPTILHDEIATLHQKPSR
jgi:hypothetical protein